MAEWLFKTTCYIAGTLVVCKLAELAIQELDKQIDKKTFE